MSWALARQYASPGMHMAVRGSIKKQRHPLSAGALLQPAERLRACLTPRTVASLTRRKRRCRWRLFLGLTLCVQVLHQILNLLWLESLSKGRHTTAACLDLMLDLGFVLASPYATQIWPELSTTPIYSMAMLTPFLMEERSARRLAIMRFRLSHRY